MLFKIALTTFLLPSFFVFSFLTYEEPWGKDSDLKAKEFAHTTNIRSPSIATLIAEKIIIFHQKVLSPVDGPRSEFKPCSSQYMKLSMMKHGFCKGFLMGCDRLMRENKDPWVYRNVEVNGKLIKYDPPR